MLFYLFTGTGCGEAIPLPCISITVVGEEHVYEYVSPQPTDARGLKKPSNQTENTGGGEHIIQGHTEERGDVCLPVDR